MTYVLGLTGGIACGKTTASNILREFGAKIIDGDIVARQLQCKNQIGLNKIVTEFGTEYLLSNGELNRKKLGDLVFNNQKELEKLNQIMSPLIKHEILNELQNLKQKQVKLIVLDIALLFEGKYERFCTSTMVICTTRERQIKQLMERNHFTKQDAIARIDAQISSKVRNQNADFIIKNDGTFEDLKLKMIKWLSMNKLL
ncbi:dephospho-CoA kinase [Ligilactobacillus cholophilus]|uniref:dephospho-CoA kinase n=1 Tax=Ligilactobacillus cholophilus TaxID=3050131 RepID=UPI0025B1098E|nr:dephospho-CoA kinase [Ligilactobacillus cholophilus]